MTVTDMLLMIAHIKSQARDAKPGDAAPVSFRFRAFSRRLRLRGIVEVEE